MSAVSLNRELFAALVDELAIVVGAMIDASPSVAAGAPAMGRQWVAEIHASGALEGAVTLVMDYDGCAGITRQMTGVDGELPSEAVLDTLREVLAQAVGSLSLKPVARGAKLTVASLVEKDDLVPEGEWSAHAIEADKLSTALSVTVWGSLSSPQPAAVAAVAAAAPASASNDDRIEILLDIDLPLVVRFGQTELPLRQLTRLGPGSIIDLGRSPDDPVDVLVSNRVVARGEVVVVAGSYGIRILDVVSQRERVRSMEG